MTIIAELPQDTRAKRKVDPSFRLAGGPMPLGKPGPRPINPKVQEDQSNTEESGLQ